MKLTQSDFAASAPRAKDVTIFGRAVRVTFLTAAEVSAIEYARLRPQPPLIPHPAAKTAAEREELIPNYFDPRYKQDVEKYRETVQLGQFAAATGYQTADGRDFEAVRRSGDAAELSAWLITVQNELGSVITWDAVTVVLEAVKSLSGVGDAKGLEAAAKNS